MREEVTYNHCHATAADLIAEVLRDGRIAYAIKTPRRGRTHRVMTPMSTTSASRHKTYVSACPAWKRPYHHHARLRQSRRVHEHHKRLPGRFPRVSFGSRGGARDFISSPLVCWRMRFVFRIAVEPTRL